MLDIGFKRYEVLNPTMPTLPPEISQNDPAFPYGNGLPITSSKDYVHSTFPLLSISSPSPGLRIALALVLANRSPTHLRLQPLLAPAAARPIHQAEKVYCRIARSTVDSTIYIIQNKLIDKNG